MSTWLISANGLLLTAGNGLPSVGATPPPVATASAEITVSKRLVTATAPDMVVFEITNFSGFDTSGPAVGEVYNPRYHDLYYFWDFGDTTYSSFSAPTRVRSAHNNPNVMYGPFGRHVYRNAGSYSPKCTIYEPSSGKFAVAYLNAASTDSGTAGTATAALDVADPDTTFSGSQTIFVSASGDFTNAPSGATQVTATDVDATINTYIEGQAVGTPLRLMFNRGETYEASINTIGGGNTLPTFHMVAGPGGGAKPIINCPSNTYIFQWNDSESSSSGIKDVVVQNIDFRGAYNGLTDAGNKAILFATPSTGPNNVLSTVLFHQCDVQKFETLALDGSASSNHEHFAVVDCNITEWRECGMYDYGAQYTTFLGISMTSRVDQPVEHAGGLGSPHRGGKTQFVCFASDIFSKQGWTGSPRSGKNAEQPCLRINAEAERGGESYVGCSYFEGGGGGNTMINYTQSGVSTAQISNNVFEKNTCLGSAQTGKFIGVSMSGLTVRNNLFVWPMADLYGPGEVLFLAYPGTYTENRDGPIRAYSNSIVYLRDDSGVNPANFINNIDQGSGAFTDVVAANNIYHQPNITSPTDLGLADTTNDYSPLCPGYIGSSITDYGEGTAHVAIDFDAQTGAFTAGLVLTGGTSGATARINYIQDNGTTGTLWLGEVTGGPFVNDETITDTSTGSATVNGSQRDSGFTDDFIPLTGSSVIGAYTTGKVAYDDFYGNIRDTVLSGLTRSAYSTGAHEPALES